MTRILICLTLFSSYGFGSWVQISAKDKFERTKLMEAGFHLDSVDEDVVYVNTDEKGMEKLKSIGFKFKTFNLPPSLMDFPSKDSDFHNYDEVQSEIQAIAALDPDIVTISSIGKSVEGRDLTLLTIGTVPPKNVKKPAVFFMGTHHAREHLSTEIPLMLARYLVEKFVAGDADVVQLLTNRTIFVLPLVNPDGAEFDVTGNKYKYWRKNRIANSDGTKGVDLNRNYSFRWGQGGSSDDPSDETYMGPNAFSEPETQAVKNFIDTTDNINVLLTFHSFSKLVLYPWGGDYQPIQETKDAQVFKKMAQTMAGWNKYKPMQASDLYLATGDTCDWAYATHKIFAFTFELDPGSPLDGGFYPGQSFIQPVFQKNLKPALYLIEYADDPYRVLNGGKDFGLSSPIVSRNF